MLSSLHHPITKKMGTKKATTTTGSLKLEVPTAIRWFVSYLPSSSGRVLGCHPENRKVSNSYDYLRARDRLRQVFKEQSEQSLPFLSMGNNHRYTIGGRNVWHVRAILLPNFWLLQEAGAACLALRKAS